MTEIKSINIKTDKEIKEQKEKFHSSENIEILRKSIQEANEGKFVTKTLDELRAME